MKAGPDAHLGQLYSPPIHPDTTIQTLGGAGDGGGTHENTRLRVHRAQAWRKDGRVQWRVLACSPACPPRTGLAQGRACAGARGYATRSYVDWGVYPPTRTVQVLA